MAEFVFELLLEFLDPGNFGLFFFLFLLDFGQDFCRGRQGQMPRNEEVSRMAIGDILDVARSAQPFDILSQKYFHTTIIIPSSSGAWQYWKQWPKGQCWRRDSPAGCARTERCSGWSPEPE